jgi:acyl-CoA synthetase (AMP-forming)/AMP-acid ligase II
MTTLLTLSDAVATHARLRPNKLAVRDSRRQLTYRAWDERATRLVAALRSLGLAKGDRVGVIAYNCLEWMEIYAGMARAGLVVVPLNFRLTGPEMAYILGHSEVSAVIAGPQFCTTLESVRSQLALSPQRWVCLDATPRAGWTAYESLMAENRAEFAPVEVSPDDMCALMYTSGTTGRPKGAIRSHGGNALIAVATALEMGFTSQDTALLVMPLCHANSLYFGSTFVHMGGTIIIDDRASFDAEALLQTLSQDRVTFTSLVPTHYIMLLALPEDIKRRFDLSAVGKLMISSAPARQETKRGIMELFPNGQLYELYGSTEAGWVTLLRPDEQLRKLGSVGREWACSGAIRLLDERRQEVADGEVGELFSRTAYMFDGYWKNPEKTSEALDGTWCSVGDMARRDEDGYIWLVDRKSNMIISGGENIYPSEVEAALGQHPKVRDVAVIGVPHDKWGETAKAIVVTHNGQTLAHDELRAWCRERLAAFKCPTSFDFIADEQMPRTATGKILHRALRQTYIAG